MGFTSLWALSLSLPLLPPKVPSSLVAPEMPDAFLKVPEASVSSLSSMGSDHTCLSAFSGGFGSGLKSGMSNRKATAQYGR